MHAWPHPHPHDGTAARPAPALSPRLGAGLLMGLLHLGLVLILWDLPVWADRVSITLNRPLLWVTVAPPPPEAAADPAAARPRPLPRPLLQPLPLPQPSPRQPEPQAITLPAVAPSPSAAPTEGATPATASPPAGGAPPAALNLSLPRGASAPWRQRNPALDDPRSNTARLSLEQKLANAMGGDGSWHEERLDLDTVRWRRGNECILATRSRAGQLELGSNGAFRNSWLVRNC